MVRVFSAIVVYLATAIALEGFPPAPHFTIYGDVRDQYGALLPADGSSVILYQGSKEILRRPLMDLDEAPFNYEIRMRIDMFRPSTTSYSSRAMRSGADYTLAVDIGGQHFAPLEMKTTHSVGSPAGRVRLDLTLGVDSEGDGMPDAWKEAQLFHAGYLPGPDGWDLSLIDRDGDFDGDGLSNWSEYVAGTYATDVDSYLKLEIKEVVDSVVHLEFYAIHGKSYSLQTSDDLETWLPTEFFIEDPQTTSTELQASISATTTGVMSIYAETATPAGFYRLTVR